MQSDPRFIEGVTLFNRGDYVEASDLFEELFFEAVGDELDFVRVFLQFSVGCHHAEMGQRRPAVERIEEGIRTVAVVRNTRGFDLAALSEGMRKGVAQIRAKEKPEWPFVKLKVES